MYRIKKGEKIMLLYNHKYKIYKHDILLTEQSVGGITINIDCEYKQPTFNSWAGFDQHVNNLVELGLDKNIAYLLVSYPELPDEDLIFLSTHLDALNEVVDATHPFNDCFGPITMSLVRQWVVSYRHVKFSNFNKWNEIYTIVKNTKIRKIVFSTIFSYGLGYSPEVLEKINNLKSPTEEKVISMLIFGTYKPSFGKKILEIIESAKIDKPDDISYNGIFYTLTYIAEMAKIFNVPIDRLSMDNCCDISQHSLLYKILLSVGFRHSDIKPIWNLDLPKKEKIKYSELVLNGKEIEYVLKDICTEIFNIPANIHQYMIYHNSTRDDYYADLIRFVLRNKSKWTKTKTIYGPNGQTANIHIHRLISKITPEILTSHKLGWDVVMEEIEKKEIEKLHKQFQNDKKPVNPFPIKKLPSDVTQLKTVGDIRLEGEKMDHCVFQYVEACMRNTYIFHVGPPAPNGATAEIFIENGRYTLAQCRGYNNDRDSNVNVNPFYKPMEKLVSQWNKK